MVSTWGRVLQLSATTFGMWRSSLLQMNATVWEACKEARGTQERGVMVQLQLSHSRHRDDQNILVKSLV